MKDLVFLQNDQPITTSLKIADTFEKRHDLILRDIRNLIQDLGGLRNFEESSMFVESTYTNQQNKLQPMYLINRDGFTLLAMGFTGKKALQFKLKYIQAFNEMEQTLIKLLAERQSAEWLEARKLSKIELRHLSDLIKEELIPLMIQEGASDNAIRWVYKNYVSMIQKLLGIQTGKRDELPLSLVYELSKVEKMAMIIIKGLIAAKTNYKQIYSDTKNKINSYVQLSLFNQRVLN